MKYEYNVVVIGAGAAGLVTSYIAATLKAKVALIEKNKMGGDCLNYGCVPSKALIKSAKIAHMMRNANRYGIASAEPQIDFADVMGRIHRVIRTIEPHDSVERYTKLGVECIHGEAHIISPNEVRVNGRTLTTRAIVVATGAAPAVPDTPGLNDIAFLTSDNLWEIKELPKRLTVLGGGPIGSELAQSFARLGSKVTMIERRPRLMSREDEDVSEEVTRQFMKDGIQIITSVKDIRFQATAKGHSAGHAIVTNPDGQNHRVDFDHLLIAVGRRARVTGFGLEGLGVTLNKTGTVQVDDFLATNYNNIFVCGDVAGPYQFTHVAAHQAYYAAVNSLFHPFTRWIAPFAGKAVKAHYNAVPWATYTDPEVATVGLTEMAMREKNKPYDITKYELNDLDRAIADSEDHGFVKVLTEPGKDKILGATIVGQHASDMIGEFISAVRFGRGLSSIMGTIHIYPTMSEANKYAAGQWKNARKPEATLRKLERFFEWRRK